MNDLMGMLSQFWPFILLILFFYFVMIRPQKKQQDKRKAFLGSLKRGDYVLTAGGVFGKIKRISGNIVSLQIAPNVIIEADKRALQQVPPDSFGDNAEDDDDDEADDEPEDDSEDQETSENETK
jgi:preprotein translocase subunit YajC